MSTRLPRYPFVLLGAMTLLTFGGPLGIGFVLRGGPSPDWPPDRPVEWMVVLGVSGMVLALMGACLALIRTNNKAMAAASKAKGPGEPGEARR